MICAQYDLTTHNSKKQQRDRATCFVVSTVSCYCMCSLGPRVKQCQTAAIMSIISHRVLQRWAANSMTRWGSVVAASTYCPNTPKSCLTLKPTSSPLPAGRIGAVTAQRRELFLLQLSHSSESYHFPDIGKPRPISPDVSPCC